VLENPAREYEQEAWDHQKETAGDGEGASKRANDYGLGDELRRLQNIGKTEEWREMPLRLGESQ